MAQDSIFWTTNSVGDGASTYNQDDMFGFVKRSFGDGVISGYTNGLVVSGALSPVAVNTGAAFVNGAPYLNTASVNLAVPTPVSGTTAHRVVLRWDDTANTVRLVLLSAADGVSTPPTLTVVGTIFEVLVADLTITTLGVIAVSNTQQYIGQITRTLFVPAVAGEEVVSGTLLPVRQLGVDLPSNLSASAYTTFVCPQDLVSNLAITPVFIPQAVGNVVYQHGYYYGSAGEAWNTNSTITLEATQAVTTDIIYSPTALALGGIAAGDYVICAASRTGEAAADTNSGVLICTGFLVSYTAAG